MSEHTDSNKANARLVPTPSVEFSTHRSPLALLQYQPQPSRQPFNCTSFTQGGQTHTTCYLRLV